MTDQQIIDMAKAAGFVDYEIDDGTTRALDPRFGRLIQAAMALEREACAVLVVAAHADADNEAHPDAAVWLAACFDAIVARRPPLPLGVIDKAAKRVKAAGMVGLDLG